MKRRDEEGRDHAPAARLRSPLNSSWISSVEMPTRIDPNCWSSASSGSADLVDVVGRDRPELRQRSRR